MKRCLLTLACAFSLIAGHALAAGMLIPKDESIPPLAIESQRIDIRISGDSVIRLTGNVNGKKREFVYEQQEEE